MLRRLFRLLVVLSVVAILGVVTVWVATNTDFGRERVRRYVVGILQHQTHGIVRVEKMNGNLLSGAMLVKVSITDSAAHPFFKADSVSLRYVMRSFFSSKLLFDNVVVYHPDVVVARLPNGPWNYRILWPAGPKKAPGDSTRGWGDWVTLTNATIIDGNVTVRSPWAPRAGVSARVRDSIVKDALDAGSRLYIAEAPGGYQKVITLQKVNAKLPLVRWEDPAYRNRQLKVASLNMQAYPFRPPAADVRALAGTFDFDDDSLWWKGATGRLPNTNFKGDGVYNLNNGDMQLSLAATPATFKDFHWLYPHFPLEGGGSLGLLVQWKGSTQDYIVRGADVRTGSAHLAGDVGVTIADTVFFHDANVRFTGVTTKQIEELSPGIKSPRQGVLSGRAKFDGTFKRMHLASSDITFAAYNRGTSRVIADGIVGFMGTTKVVVSAKDLHVRIAPLQIDIVKLLFPTLPVGGTLAGSATLNGSGDRQLYVSNLDITHTDGANVTHAVGRAAVHTTGRQTLDLDVNATQLALAELTKFAPTLLLKNNASGPIHAHGPIDALRVDTRLNLPGGGEFAMRGTVDFLSKELGYDVAMDMRALDLSWVVMYGPVTSLSGNAIASGRGFKTPTMRSDVAIELGPSSVDTIGVDSVSVRARLANGIANIERAHVTGSGATADFTGQFGLDSNFVGKLAYDVKIDTLTKFARYIPGQGTLDTTIVKPRPRVAAEARRRARADSARVAIATVVERAMRNAAPEPLRIPTDTPRAIPKDLLAGSLSAKGTITGSVDRFSLEGTAEATGLVVQGNSAKHLSAEYNVIDARTKSSKLGAKVSADSISAYGFVFDSLNAEVGYVAPNGTMSIAVRQGAQRDYSLAGDFTLDKARNVLSLSKVALRFDSTTWASSHSSSIHWGTAGIEVLNLELTSGVGRRIYANGLLPTKGTANFDLAVSDFEVANIAELLQSDLPVTGRVTLDAHVSGTAEDPKAAGKIDFVKGTYNDTPVPEVHGTFAYANKQLTTNAAVQDSTGKVLARLDGTVPIDLALSGVTGSRLLDLPVNFTLASDSLPIELIPQFTAAVTDVAGRATGTVKVGGTLKKPALTGNVLLTDVQFKVAATGTFMEHVNGAIRMTGDSVFVDSIAGSAGGPIRLAGTIGVGNWREPSFDLNFTAEDAQLVNNEMGEVHANAGLHLTGALSSPYVSGEVTVVHGVLYIPESRGKKVIGAGDPALFSVIDTSLTVQKDLFPATSPMFRNLRVDVDFVVNRDTWVRSRDANVEVFTDGPMQLRVVGEALALTGALDADRGEYTFLSRRFQIKRGSALFIGTPDLNPTLQITAEYQIKQVAGPATNIRVLIGGTVEAPRISLESDAQPPLSQSALLTYLAFGESSTSLVQLTASSLTPQSGGNLLNVATTRLAGIALGVALDEVKGSAARSLGLDVFNVTPGDLPLTQASSGLSDFLRGTEIEAGRYLNPQTFVSVIATPGLLTCGGRGSNQGSACTAPGATVTHRTRGGLRFDVSFSPRYLLDAPTLAPQTYQNTAQFGAFLIREWRF
ncbi:MAG: translocation/assembly module TamB domain-containing protein [Gemmatimonadaceae bacterium]